jgi:hypothetical protein
MTGAKSIPVAEMINHVESLCRSHNIGLFWCVRSDRSYSMRALQEVMIAPIKSVVTYAVALHEIGHLRGRHQDSRRCMVRERWAWDWAKRNALVWTPRMVRCAAASYADGHADVVDQNWQPDEVPS